MTARGGALLVVVAISACSVARAEPRPKLDKPSNVKSLQALRALRRDDIVAQLRLAPGDVENDVAYEKVKRVARLHNGAVYPGHFFVRGDELVVLYIGEHDFLSALSPAAIKKELGGDGTRLRSRAGKRSNQYVYPGSGFAYSETDGTLDFVEVFAPMSLAAYRDKIYEEPHAFTK